VVGRDRDRQRHDGAGGKRACLIVCRGFRRFEEGGVGMRRQQQQQQQG
jgi:hypothetical protein